MSLKDRKRSEDWYSHLRIQSAAEVVRRGRLRWAYPYSILIWAFCLWQILFLFLMIYCQILQTSRLSNSFCVGTTLWSRPSETNVNIMLCNCVGHLEAILCIFVNMNNCVFLEWSKSKIKQFLMLLPFILWLHMSIDCNHCIICVFPSIRWYIFFMHVVFRLCWLKEKAPMNYMLLKYSKRT